MFCYPKQKTARERTSGRESRAEPGSRNNDMPSTQSHLGLPTRNIIQKKDQIQVCFGCGFAALLSLGVKSCSSLFRRLVAAPLVGPRRRIGAIPLDDPRRDEKHVPQRPHLQEPRVFRRGSMSVSAGSASKERRQGGKTETGRSVEEKSRSVIIGSDMWC